MLKGGPAQAGSPGGLQITIKASTLQTAGCFNLFEIECPSGFATPLHILYANDVALYVLEGALTVYWGEDRKEALPGAYLSMPRCTPYGFRVTGAAGARLLYVSVPGGLDDLVEKRGRWAGTSECLVAAARHKIEILGPLFD